MLLNTLLDYILDKNGDIDTTIKFHVPLSDEKEYEEYGLPFTFHADGYVINSRNEAVPMYFEFLESIDWEILDVESPADNNSDNKPIPKSTLQ